MQMAEGSTLSTWVTMIFLLCSFPSLSWPLVPLQKNMSINVYGVYDDNEVIYPLRVSFTLVPDGHDGVHHYTTLADWLGDS